MSTDSEKKKSGGILSKLGAALAFLIAKGKAILAVIFKVKGLASVLSMLLSIFVYWKTWNLGLSGAVGFVLLLLVHEYGHVWALKRLGVPASAPMFIPFLGAVIGMKAMPKNARDEAFMAMAGPVFGSVGALACFGIYSVTHVHLWLWLASTGFLLNLFNLIPISPLDGGRVIGAVWRGFWYLGLVLLAAGAIYFKDAFLWFICIIGAMEINRRYRQFHPVFYLIGAGGCAIFAFMIHSIIATIALLAFAAFLFWQFKTVFLDGEADDLAERVTGKPAEDDAAYFAVPTSTRIIITLTYFGLAGLLGALLYWTSVLSSHVTIG